MDLNEKIIDWIKVFTITGSMILFCLFLKYRNKKINKKFKEEQVERKNENEDFNEKIYSIRGKYIKMLEDRFYNK